MEDERVWHVVGEEEHDGGDGLLKRLVIVGAVAVVAGFLLSFAYSRWSGAPSLTSAFPREVPDSTTASVAPAETGEGGGTAGPAPAEPGRTSVSAEDGVAGEWHVTTEVRSAIRKEFEGLVLVYRLQLKQDGARITGHGEKISENGKALSASHRTPITVEGEREGDRLMLKFSERGARRASGGTFFLRLEDEKLRGTFASDAAGSKGEVGAERVRNATAPVPEQKRRAR